MNARSQSQVKPSEPRPAYPNGTAVSIAGAGGRDSLASELEHVGFASVFVEDPYDAMVKLADRPLAYRALLVSLSAVYPEELGLIQAVRDRFGHIEVIVSDVEGRSAALARAVGLGAQSLLEGGRLHRLAGPHQRRPAALPAPEADAPLAVLTDDELRALLEGN